MTTVRKNNLISILLVTIAACLLYGISGGIRSNYGVMLNDISESMVRKCTVQRACIFCEFSH